MLPSANICFDFDGTLVRENSSQVLIATLLGRATTRTERGLARLLGSRWGRLVRMAGFALGKVTAERDMLLVLVLWTFRQHLRTEGEAIFAQVAQQLTLTPELQDDYTQAFTIASTGLHATIMAFLQLHPELDCQAVYASSVDVTPGRLALRPVTMRSKVAVLNDWRPRRFLTDHRKEAELYARLEPAIRSVHQRPEVGHTNIFEVVTR